MIGAEHLTIPLNIAMVVAPVAVYFIVLGLLNSRRHPQLLTGRRDFALLIVALCPLFVLPVLGYVGVSLVTAPLAAAAVGGAIWLLAPHRRTWVIYNISLRQASDAIAQTLVQIGLAPRSVERGFALDGPDAVVEVSSFPLLQNVSVRIRHGDDDLARRFEQRLAGVLAGLRAESSPMAVAMLLVATGMLVAPLTLVAHRAGEIVRILTDLLN